MVGRLSAGARPQAWGKWVSFAASCVVQACAGLAYCFSVYAPTVKERLGLSQVEIATVGSASECSSRGRRLPASQ